MSYATVQIDLTDIDTDDLIEEIESRDYRVMAPGQIDEDVEALHRTLDEIHNLYLDFINWKNFGTNENFEKELKDFFDVTLDKVVL